MPHSNDRLNKEQKAAVEYTGSPLLVIAGAGTGKTKVIVHKIAYLIDNIGVNPNNILSVTFTNKAAWEMKSRLKNLVGERAEGVWMGTFHSICLRILRRETHKTEFKKGFGVIDQDDRLSALRSIVKELNIDSKKYPPKQYLWLISSFKNTIEYVEDKEPEEFIHRFPDVFKAYQQYLSFANLVDFDDMLALVIRIFQENYEVLELYRNIFRYIMVDEYQDTNYIQFFFLKLLSGEYGNICVVGDDDQSIYGWRGAEIRNILDFEKHFSDVKTIKLTENYRSSPNILFTANTLIANNNYRKGKNLSPVIHKMGNIMVKECHDEQDESNFVINEIELMLDQGISPAEIAVLYRTNAQSRAFEVELNRRGIPYKVIGGISFYSRREIKDILAYLKLSDNPYDIDALKRSAKNPPKGIGNVVIQRIIDYATGNGSDLISAAKEIASVSKGKTAASLKFYTNILDEMQLFENIADKIKVILNESSYGNYLKQFEEQNDANKRINNIDELINAAAIFDESYDEPDLSEFLATTTLTTSTDESAGDSVSLMTLHSAKGLEFESVFLTGLEEGLFPLFRSMDNEWELEEERRLCYVGITRAKSNLVFTHTNTRMVYGKRQFCRPSMFLDELKSDISSPGDYGKKLKANTRVFHSKYGEGVVLNVKGAGDKVKADVFFQSSGLKKMLAESLEIF
ncbi:ATP-dependent helicase [Flexistipes sp.]|uniref:ATP-dependent helicase n=1 Tax=Flexistipes sp. TaxID=3088135 RepID=UPI002E1D5429|nr:UvrD-helicase domain-containing protein [Flexistipes sp.]